MLKPMCTRRHIRSVGVPSRWLFRLHLCGYCGNSQPSRECRAFVARSVALARPSSQAACSPRVRVPPYTLEVTRRTLHYVTRKSSLPSRLRQARECRARVGKVCIGANVTRVVGPRVHIDEGYRTLVTFYPWFHDCHRADDLLFWADQLVSDM